MDLIIAMDTMANRSHIKDISVYTCVIKNATLIAYEPAGLEINFLVYWSIVQCIQIFTGQNASCIGQVLEQLK